MRLLVCSFAGIVAASILISVFSGPANAEFSGAFELGPSGCEAKGECTLTYDLNYVDANGVGWQAAAKDKTDGASIPAWAQPFIGNPFDKSYIKAAIMHDHYCDRHVRSWRATHRVFYDALLELGVEPAKAKLMYYAVYLAGPKWVTLIPGKPCGDNCLFRVDGEGAKNANASKEITITRPAEYDKAGFTEELKQVEALLKEHAAEVDLAALEKRAQDRKAGDFYYKNGDTVQIGKDAAE